MIAIDQISHRLRLVVTIDVNCTKVICLDMHREFSISDEIHEGLREIILLFVFFGLRVIGRIVLLLEILHIGAGEYVGEADDKPRDALVFLLFLEGFLARYWQISL